MGPLRGVKIVEFAGIGPAPFCGMMLSDMGADVLRVDRRDPVELGVERAIPYQITRRGRRSVVLNLKSASGQATAKRLVERADGLIEGFRPGVMERLGLGPDVCLEANPKLVYGRMTGWGQDGPLASAAGHDINYVALTGVLSCIGPRGGPPIPPLNLVGDYGGGGIYLAFGMVCGIFEAARSGKGQVVDAAMIDGTCSLAAALFADVAAGTWRERRGTNIVDGGAHFYGVYETSDGKFVSVASIEKRFYQLLLNALGMDASALPDQHDHSHWPELHAKFAEVFRRKTREEWCRIMRGTDICFAPILTPSEAREDPHLKARGTFVVVDDVWQVAPAPRFSRTVPEIQSAPAAAGSGMEAALADWGFSSEEIGAIKSAT